MIPQKDYEYTTLMNMLHVSVSKHLLDEHFTLVWANDFYYDLIGYTKDEYEALYHNLPDLYYAGYQNEWNALGAAVMKALNEKKSGYSIVSRMPRKNGEFVWVQITAVFVDEYIDGRQVSYTSMTDINETMQMQKERSVTYDNLPGFVGKFLIGKDFSFTLLDASDKFIEFFGEGCWNHTDDFLFRKNLERNAIALAAQRKNLLSGKTVHFTTRMHNQYETDAWLQINATCIEWQGGNPVYLAVFIDITNETELRQMQKKLEEQAEELKNALRLAKDANRAKSDFLSHMSHDIRTPMNAIMGMTDIAQAHLDDKTKVQDCLKKIALSSQHLLGLINDVLDMSRIESGKMTLNNDSLSLPELLENIVAIMQPHIKTKNQNFSIHLKNVKHELFYSDSLRLRQIFINILSNASKFSPEEGRITVTVEEMESKKAGTAIFRFSITDTGMGMKPEFMEHLFAPFSRERDSRVDKTEGSGLGMAITKKLVDLLDGDISVQSKIGCGTAFTVTLPLQIDKTPQAQYRFSDLKIIIADDDDIMCEYTEQVMRSIGVHVDSAGTGEEAIAKLFEAQQRGKSYDAIFLDWKMPEMDGPQTARKIREEFGKELPILIVSAYDWSDIEKEAKDAGISGFISKPLFVSTLCRALCKYVLNEAPDDKAQTQAAVKEFDGKRFLLVEDNELNRDIAIELLSSEGAQIDYAINGVEGADKFKQSPQGYYDLILMDIQMPVMNGYESAKMIRCMNRSDAKCIPILAMTADAFAEDIVRAKEAGMNGHLAKPLNIAMMKREIQKALIHKDL